MSAALESVVDAYGGRSLWQRVERIRVKTRIRGWVLRLKGMGLTFPAPVSGVLYPSRSRLEFVDYPRKGDLGVYEAGSVELQAVDPARARARMPEYRRSFEGLKKYRLWSPLDSIYFFGYSLTNYLKIPFAFDGQIAAEVAPAGADTVADLTFAPHSDTHCARQRFYFERGRRLVRHDYRADILGWWATAAHHSHDYQDAAGLPVARRRQVHWRIFGWVSPLVVIDVKLEEVDVESRS